MKKKSPYREWNKDVIKSEAKDLVCIPGTGQWGIHDTKYRPHTTLPEETEGIRVSLKEDHKETQ